jgi:hypothetical protein
VHSEIRRVRANRFKRAVAVAALGAFFINSAPARAWNCVRSDEVEAFTLRHLQSTLMVAALSCNQRDAYNSFVLQFQDQLATAGRKLAAYFDRGGGGKLGLNKYVTEVANTAGLSRASDPQGFCEKTWEAFLKLQEEPQMLYALADFTMSQEMARPEVCAAGASSSYPRKRKTAAAVGSVATADGLR